MKTLRDYRVAGALFVNDTGIEAQVSDQVTLFLDTDAEPGFPESIVATIQHPIVRVECGSSTSYVLEYNEADLDGAAALLRPQDIIDASVVSGVTVVADELDDEIARALAAEALLAPKASPTFTGTVTLPSATSIGTVSATEIGYLDGVTSAIQTQLNGKAKLTGGNLFSGVQELSNGVSVSGGFTYIFSGGVGLSDSVNVSFGTTAGTIIGTTTTQKLAFHNATPVAQRAGAAQAAVTATVGASVVTTASALGSYGFTQAQADSIPVRINSLIVDNAAQAVLINELRAALVEKGIIKGAA
jgi:hypothetical protein